MPSPFPGMDPYLEASWGDIHHRFITYSCDQIQSQLPRDLKARTEERVCIGSPFQAMATIVFTGYTALWVSSYAFGDWRQWSNRTDLSYGLYVWGWPVGQILLDGVPGLSWPVLAASNVVFALAFAMLSWRLIEKPALLLKPGRRAAAAPSVARPDVAEDVTLAADQAVADEWRGALASPNAPSAMP